MKEKLTNKEKEQLDVVATFVTNDFVTFIQKLEFYKDNLELFAPNDAELQNHIKLILKITKLNLIEAFAIANKETNNDC